MAVCSEGPWYATFRSNLQAIVTGLRAVSVHASSPRFTPDRHACTRAGLGFHPIRGSFPPLQRPIST
jgi:hypothetical protein